MTLLVWKVRSDLCFKRNSHGKKSLVKSTAINCFSMEQSWFFSQHNEAHSDITQESWLCPVADSDRTYSSETTDGKGGENKQAGKTPRSYCQ